MTGIALLLDTPSERFPNNLNDFTEEMSERMRKAYELVDWGMSDRSKRRNDKRVKEVQFQVGDLVWYYCPRRRPGRSRKWQLITTEPHLFIRKVNHVNYLIITSDWWSRTTNHN